MSAFSVKASITSVVEGAVNIELEDGQRLSVHPADTTTMTPGQTLWVTLSDTPFDPTKQPKEILNTVFGSTNQ